MQVSGVVQSLEENLELLCLTGVEDQLQVCEWPCGLASYTVGKELWDHSVVSILLQLDVRPTLELLRNAGIKVSCHQ